MILLTAYDSYWQAKKTAFPAIKSVHLVANEAQLKDVINKPGEQFPMLLATIPSADPESRDVDSISEKNTCLLFILEKVAAADRTAGNYITRMTALQQIMAGIKEEMALDFEGCARPGHAVMQRLDLGSLHQDPEYNYLGCDGWSLSFRFTTLGY
jgi:hypothetical protein